MMRFKNYINCIDAHTGGEPLRIITSGFPPIPGKTILEKRDYILKNHDNLRKLMMLEPRGHSGMYGCILVDPVTEDGDLGVLFTHNGGLSSMCGHGIIAVTKVAIETGMILAEDGIKVVKIDSPAGRITAYAEVEGGAVKEVKFQNVPCFIYRENVEIEVDRIGKVVGDVAYCGAFYMFVDVAQLKIEINPDNSDELVRLGMVIKHKVDELMDFDHPESGVNWLYGSILYTNPQRLEDNTLSTKNICIFAEGQIDRSPTGTGTGGRVAIHFAKGEMKKEDTLINKSVIDTVMKGRVIEETKVGNFDAVITEVSGTAYISGFNQLVLEPEDPLPEGFRISGS